MKKYMIIGMMAFSLLGVLAGCGASADIGKDNAMQIALEDVNLAESDISRLSVTRDVENGEEIYEVKFTSGNTEYEYEVLAADGKIIKASFDEMPFSEQPSNRDLPADLPTQRDDKQVETNKQTSDNKQISRADAAKLALARVPGAGEKDLKMELDYDDGKYKYEGDIVYDGKEYEFEIDAVTGDFLEWSEERR